MCLRVCKVTWYLILGCVIVFELSLSWLDVTFVLAVVPPVEEEAEGRSLLLTNSKSSNVGCSVSNLCLKPRPNTLLKRCEYTTLYSFSTSNISNTCYTAQISNTVDNHMTNWQYITYRVKIRHLQYTFYFEPHFYLI